MQKPQESWKFFLIYSSFIAIIAILILGGMISSPSEPNSSVLLGLSLPRVLLATGLVIVCIFFVYLFVTGLREHSRAEKTFELWFGSSPLGQGISWLAGISFGLGWIGSFLPFYRAGPLGIHWERIRPMMVFLLLAGMATLIMVFIKRSSLRAQDLKLPKTYKSSLLWLLPSILLLGVMLSTQFGVYAREDYWYGAGVPILFSQLMAAILGGLLFLQSEKRWQIRHLDLIIFLVLFLVTAILWAREPLQKSFLFVGPYAPNRTLYPFADGALYDTASQFALIGRNFLFYNGPFFERALYASFLVFLHSLFGQDYGQLMAAQAAVLAIFPSLVYLIGKSFNIRAVGFAAALVAMFRGTNAIAASNMIDMASPKMMLTDFPTAIGMALLVYLTCEWLKSPHSKWYYALWVGGVIGLGIMLRTNALFILLLIPLYSFLRFSRAWKTWLTSSVLLVLAVLAITLPWELRNQSLGGTMYSSIFGKLQSVIEQRYRAPAQPGSSNPQETILSFTSFKNLQLFTEFSRERVVAQTDRSCDGAACFIPNHFLHNVLTSVLVLPTSPILDDLRHTTKESYPYWNPDWEGSFTLPSLVFFVLNIFFVVLGIHLAWSQHRLVGLVPLSVFIFYNVSNGFARTSGGRYIVPIDWIITFYFLIGVFQTIILFANALGVRWTLFSRPVEPGASRQESPRNNLSRVVFILAILFALGALVPLAEIVNPDRYENFNFAKTLAAREAQINNAGLSLEEVNLFLENPGAEISVGRALYPRYYIENEGEIHFQPYVAKGFPRTTFALIGREGEKGVILPSEKPQHFPHAVDILVIGCKEQFYVDALAVIILDETGTVYTRNPESPLQCPLKQPVCDNNHNCY